MPDPGAGGRPGEAMEPTAMGKVHAKPTNHPSGHGVSREENREEALLRERVPFTGILMSGVRETESTPHTKGGETRAILGKKDMFRGLILMTSLNGYFVNPYTS